MSLVLTPSTTAQRTRLVRFGVLIFLTSLPIAGVLLALVNWQVALLYIVVWTVGLLFGVRQQRTTLLRVDDAGEHHLAPAVVGVDRRREVVDRADRDDPPVADRDATLVDPERGDDARVHERQIGLGHETSSVGGTAGIAMRRVRRR